MTVTVWTIPVAVQVTLFDVPGGLPVEPALEITNVRINK
jgi:hypothetical protein